MAHSDYINNLFKIVSIPVPKGRYCEDNLKTLVTKFEQVIETKEALESDNKYLRDKLDEVSKTDDETFRRTKTFSKLGNASKVSKRLGRLLQSKTILTNKIWRKTPSTSW